MRINIVDSIMGSGKSAAAINYINSSSEDTLFLYITPFLSEVERIIEECPEKHFCQPKKYNEKVSKLINLKDLLNKRKNIATTHALFHLFDDEIIDLCYSQGYVLIMDEVTDVIESYNIGSSDLKVLLDRFVTVNEDGLMVWREDQEEYQGEKFIIEKNLCNKECLYLSGNKIVFWMFPIKIFEAFRDIYILTYMFDGQLQKYYYDYHNLEYTYLYVAGDTKDTSQFTKHKPEKEVRYNYNELITIIDDAKLNMIGDASNAFSKTWYIRNKDNLLMKQIQNHTKNFFTNKKIVYDEESKTWKASWGTNNIWTTFKDYKKLIQGKGYTKGFLPSNIRATNDYQDRTAVAYLVNKFFNPYIKSFFESQGIEIDEDAYATSEMLQFIWRSAIRQGKHITIYIPSRRMRELLRKWIAEVSGTEYSEEAKRLQKIV